MSTKHTNLVYPAAVLPHFQVDRHSSQIHLPEFIHIPSEKTCQMHLPLTTDTSCNSLCSVWRLETKQRHCSTSLFQMKAWSTHQGWHGRVLLNNAHHFSTRTLGLLFWVVFFFTAFEHQNCAKQIQNTPAAQLKWSLWDYSLCHLSEK